MFVSYDKTQDSLTAITFTCSIQVAGGILLDVYYYGCLNSVLCWKHVTKAISKISSGPLQPNPTVTVVLHLPENVESEVVIGKIKNSDLTENSEVISVRQASIVTHDVNRLIAYKDTY